MNYQWLAGIFDGEGSVSIYIKKSGTASVTIAISQNNLMHLQQIQQFLGYGTIQPKKKGGYDLRIRRKADIHRFILAVQPFSRWKYQVLDLAMLAISIGTGHSAWSDEQKYRAAELYNQLVLINRRD